MIVRLSGFGRWISGDGDDMPGLGLQYHAVISAQCGNTMNPNHPTVRLPVGAYVPLWEWSSIEGHRRV